MSRAEVSTPTIGIGAGPGCDGQVLVFHDILNLTFGPQAKFVRRYGDAAAEITHSVQAYRADVLARKYPADSESYHLSAETKQALELLLERKKAMRARRQITAVEEGGVNIGSGGLAPDELKARRPPPPFPYSF